METVSDKYARLFTWVYFLYEMFLFLRTCRDSREIRDDHILDSNSCTKTYRATNKTESNESFKSFASVGSKNVTDVNFNWNKKSNWRFVFKERMFYPILCHVISFKEGRINPHTYF